MLLASQCAVADSLRSAQHLLSVANAQQQFEARINSQARAILRHYDSIVATSADTTLPDDLRQHIVACYSEAYAWENFEPGIAAIFAANLTEKELGLLTDFYRNLGVPPHDIQEFRALIAKSTRIQQLSLDYIFEHSDGCVEQDVDLILDYLFTQRAVGTALGTE